MLYISTDFLHIKRAEPKVGGRRKSQSPILKKAVREGCYNKCRNCFLQLRHPTIISILLFLCFKISDTISKYHLHAASLLLRLLFSPSIQIFYLGKTNVPLKSDANLVIVCVHSKYFVTFVCVHTILLININPYYQIASSTAKPNVIYAPPPLLRFFWISLGVSCFSRLSPS